LIYLFIQLFVGYSLLSPVIINRHTHVWRLMMDLLCSLLHSHTLIIGLIVVVAWHCHHRSLVRSIILWKMMKSLCL